MGYTVELRPQERIIWVKWGADFDPDTETAPALKDEIAILDAARVPLVMIVDLRMIAFNWEGILYLASHAVPENLREHPNLRRIITILTDEIHAQIVKGMDHEAFGFVKLDIVSSGEEAIARAQQYLA